MDALSILDEIELLEDNDDSILNEGLFSRKIRILKIGQDLYWDIDNPVKGNNGIFKGVHNILYIIGTHVDGPSPIAEKMISKFHAEYFNFDDVINVLDIMEKEDKSICENWLCEYYEKKLFKKNPKEMKNSSFIGFEDLAMAYLQKKIRNHDNTIFIIEGQRLANIYKLPLVINTGTAIVYQDDKYGISQGAMIIRDYVDLLQKSHAKYTQNDIYSFKHVIRILNYLYSLSLSNNFGNKLFKKMYKFESYIFNEYISDNCDLFVTEQMILECSNSKELIENQSLLEGAKFDIWVKNFLSEGEDYKGLKKEIKTVIKANKLSEEEININKKGLMNSCKRILQISMDILSIASGAAGGILTVKDWKDANNLFKKGNIYLDKNKIYHGFGKTALISGFKKLGIFAIGFIITRLIRFAVDSAEFKSLEKDCKSIISDLNKASDKAKKNGDNELADHYDSEAKRLEKALKVYSNKSKIKESLIFDNIELI